MEDTIFGLSRGDFSSVSLCLPARQHQALPNHGIWEEEADNDTIIVRTLCSPLMAVVKHSSYWTNHKCSKQASFLYSIVCIPTCALPKCSISGVVSGTYT
jgi:hypothetical protein